MKTLGIVGGTGPESTIDYYRSLIATYRSRVPDGSYPPLLINSIDNQKLLTLIGANELEAVTQYLLEGVQTLERAGADFGLLAANTPHIIFDSLAERSPIPLISIVDATCAAAMTAGFKRVGLFGTRFTMQGDFYSKVFARAGIVLGIPDRTDQEYIHARYMDELIRGIFLPETRAELLAIAGRLKTTQNIEALILGGTELPLILRDAEIDGLPFLDTAKIHVEAAVNWMLG
jgi:aspartate racemase